MGNHSYLIICNSMENGKKIVISLVAGISLVIGGFFIFSEKKAPQYGYELTGQTGGTIAVNESSVATGTIAIPTATETLAYINAWKGDVKKEQK